MPLKVLKIKVYGKANSTQHGTGFLKDSLEVSYKTKLQYSGQMMQIAGSQEKTLMLGKIEGRRRSGRQDEMVGWHHRLDRHEFEQTGR